MPKPKMITIDSCDFPIVETEREDYKVLMLPSDVRTLFDEEGAHVVRINSLEIAKRIPDYGGKTSGNYSLLPHQDHLGKDMKARFLALSNLSEGPRESVTVVTLPNTAARILAIEEAYFSDPERRSAIGKNREYDPRFCITEAQYDRCFDHEDGYEEAVAVVAGKRPSAALELAARLGIYGYLMRGPAHADELMQRIVARTKNSLLIEEWNEPGVVIIDNDRVFHARFGGNTPPLKRNFFD